jgi:hypothetical protein
MQAVLGPLRKPRSYPVELRRIAAGGRMLGGLKITYWRSEMSIEALAHRLTKLGAVISGDSAADVWLPGGYPPN